MIPLSGRAVSAVATLLLSSLPFQAFAAGDPQTCASLFSATTFTPASGSYVRWVTDNLLQVTGFVPGEGCDGKMTFALDCPGTNQVVVNSVGGSRSFTFSFAPPQQDVGCTAIVTKSFSDTVSGVARLDLNFVRDITTATTVNLTAPATSTIVTGSPITFAADVTTKAPVTVTKMEFYAAGVNPPLLGEDTTAPYTLARALNPGVYSIHAVAVDSRGMRSHSESRALTVVQNQAPAVRFVSPRVGQSFGQPATLRFEAVASDPDGYVAEVRFFNSATATTPARTITRSGPSTDPFVHDWVGPPLGAHALFVEATDNLGSTARVGPLPVTVVTNPVPVIEMARPTGDGEYFMAGVAYELKALIHDARASVPTPTFHIEIPNQTAQSIDGSAPVLLRPGVWSSSAWFTYGGTVSNTFAKVRVATRDAANNSVASPQRRAVVVGSTDPHRDPDPFIQILEPVSQQIVRTTSGNQLRFAACARDRTASGVRTINAIEFRNTSNVVLATSGPGITSPKCLTESPTAPPMLLYTASVSLASSVTGIRAAIARNPGGPAIDSGMETVVVTVSNVPTAPRVLMPTLTHASAPGELNTLTLPLSTAATISASAWDQDPSGSIAKYEFFLDGVRYSTGPETASSYAWTPDEAGEYQWTVRVTDNTGAVTESRALRVTVNNAAGNVAPSVTWTSPLHGSSVGVVAGGAGPVTQISLQATDPNGIRSVKVFDGATLLGTATHAGGGQYNLSFTPALGSHALTARVVDSLGAHTTTAVSNFFVTSRPPSITLVEPVHQTPNMIAPRLVALRSLVSDPDSPSIVVDYMVNGQVVTATPTTPPFEHMFRVPAAGAYTFAAIARDGANNTVSPNTVTVNFAANRNPSIALTSPVQGAVYLQGSDVRFSAVVSDPDAPFDRVDFVRFVDPQNGQYATGAAETGYSATPAALLAPGTYTVRGEAWDRHEGMTATAPVTFTVRQHLPPAVDFPRPRAIDGDDNFFLDDNIRLTATATDPDTAIDAGNRITRVSFYRRQGQSAPVLIGEDTTAPYSIQWVIPGAVPLGAHDLYVVAEDNGPSGRNTTTSALQSIQIRVNHAPEAVAILNPAMPRNYSFGEAIPPIAPLIATNAPIVRLHAKVVDAENNVEKVEFYAGIRHDQATLIGTAGPMPGKVDEFAVDVPFNFASSRTNLIFAKAYSRRGGTVMSEVAPGPLESGHEPICGNPYGGQSTQKECWNLAVPVAIHSSGLPGPYNGVPVQIDVGLNGDMTPDRVEAEQYLLGGQGNAYFDRNARDPMVEPPYIREDDVEIENCTSMSPANSACQVGQFDNGEFLKFALQVAQDGNYSVRARMWIPAPRATIVSLRHRQKVKVGDAVALNAQVLGTRDRPFKVRVHGKIAAVSGSLSASNYFEYPAGPNTWHQPASGCISNPSTCPAYEPVSISGWTPTSGMANDADGDAHTLVVEVLTLEAGPNGTTFVKNWGPRSDGGSWMTKKTVILSDEAATPTGDTEPVAAKSAGVETTVVPQDDGDLLGFASKSPSGKMIAKTADPACVSSRTPVDPANLDNRWFDVVLCNSQPLAAGQYIMTYKSPTDGLKLDYFEFGPPTAGDLPDQLFVVSPSTGSTYRHGSNIRFQAEYRGGNPNQFSLVWFARQVGGSPIQIGGNQLETNWSTPLNPPPGSNDWDVWVEAQQQGETRVRSPDVRVSLVTNTLKAPVVQITRPVQQQTYLFSQGIALEATAYDPDGSILASSVEFVVDDVVVKQATLQPATNRYVATLAPGEAAIGAHQVFVRARDNDNLLGVSSAVAFEVGVQVPTITVSASPNANLVAPADTVLSASVVSNFVVSEVRFLNANGMGELCTGVQKGSGHWSCPWAGIIVGEYDVIAQVRIFSNVFLSAPIRISVATPVQPEILYFHHTNLQGSVVATTNADGELVHRQHFRPFGNAVQRAGVATTDLGYTGKRYDSVLDLNYYGARYYDPEISRFLSIDPEEFSESKLTAFGRYQYVENSPLALVDPDGRASVGEMISSGAEGCGPVTCAGWAAGAALWAVFGAEGVSQVYDKGTDAGGMNMTMAVIEVGTVGQGGKVMAGVEYLLSLGVKEAKVTAAGVETAEGLYDITREAGSIRGVNTIGGNMNCVNCAIATDATLAGRPTSALGGGPYPIGVLETFYNARFGAPGSIDTVSEAMSAAGSGARGIVFGSRRGGRVGHVFNVVNQDGVVRFLDGQAGTAASFKGYESFQLLRTN